MNRGIFATNLSGGYGAHTVLHNLSFYAHPGEIVGVIGPNGCGKSTLLKMCTGILPHTGTLLLGGKCLTSLTPKHRAQTVTLIPPRMAALNLTVFQYVSLGRTPYHSSHAPLWPRGEKKRVEKILTEVGILHLAHRKTTTLSSGEQQLAQCCRALCQDPDIYLFDEPLAHLDITHQGDILSLMHTMAHRGKTVVVVIHDLTVAGLFCSRLNLLNHGRIIAEGPAEEVLQEKHLHQVYQGNVSVGNPHMTTPVILPRIP
ncbi:ABC transporter ATP-binding protein [Chitinivibrio alkaliphilus]|uniref:ABC transporter, ATP-binding protein n=1 Tax=Chitinivibrio alkaliphilus ACht1 TaxID=1313304 RepID=U7DAX6_9BACT|nr:ABC transporter ATP-binding protein [Chitinivibrio alkaliphilus]ERP39182.1 ABC transporter, ATP-binding protein [Chitinivibrio alkaliphilus ACht1]